MNKFKVGDTIIKVKEGNNKYTIGKKLKIREIHTNNYRFYNTPNYDVLSLSKEYAHDNYELISNSSNNYEIY